MSDLLSITVTLSNKEEFCFKGYCLARVLALNHDESVRRQFSVYAHGQTYVSERIDSPGTIDARYWGDKCEDARALYDFFGNEPLANYLYGKLSIDVPGLRVVGGIC